MKMDEMLIGLLMNSVLERAVHWFRIMFSL